MDDDYMRERAADVKDISERLISILNGDDTDASLNDEPAIIVADDLAPSETVQMDKDKVLSFVTVHGSLIPTPLSLQEPWRFRHWSEHRFRWMRA